MSTNCGSTLATYTIGCLDNMGGNKRVFFSIYTGSTVYTIDATAEISGVTGNNAVVEIEQFDESMTLKSEGAVGENGTPIFTTTIDIVFKKFDTAIRNQLLLLGANKLTIYTVDNNDFVWALNPNSYFKVKNSAVDWGKAGTDFNGATLSFETKSKYPPQKIAAGSTALTTLGII